MHPLAQKADPPVTAVPACANIISFVEPVSPASETVGQQTRPFMRKMALSVGSRWYLSAAVRDVRGRTAVCGSQPCQAPTRGRANHQSVVDTGAARMVHAAAFLPVRPRLLRSARAASSRSDANAVGERPASGLENSALVQETSQTSAGEHSHDKGAAEGPLESDIDTMRSPVVDWSKAGETEATSTSGRVRAGREACSGSELPCPKGAPPRCCAHGDDTTSCADDGHNAPPPQVVIAQANFMRVLVNMKDMTKLQRETRIAQLEARQTIPLRAITKSVRDSFLRKVARMRAVSRPPRRLRRRHVSSPRTQAPSTT